MVAVLMMMAACVRASSYAAMAAAAPAPPRGRLTSRAAKAAGRGSHVKLKADDKDEDLWHLDGEQPRGNAEWALQKAGDAASKAGDAIDWTAPMLGKALIAAVLLACVWMVVRASLGGSARSRARARS
jgi:hypothetical protein